MKGAPQGHRAFCERDYVGDYMGDFISDYTGDCIGDYIGDYVGECYSQSGPAAERRLGFQRL